MVSKKMKKDKKKGYDQKEVFEELNCCHNWQMCLFDYSYKNKLPEYFVFIEKKISSYVKESFFDELLEEEQQFEKDFQATLKEIPSKE